MVSLRWIFSAETDATWRRSGKEKTRCVAVRNLIFMNLGGKNEETTYHYI